MYIIIINIHNHNHIYQYSIYSLYHELLGYKTFVNFSFFFLFFFFFLAAAAVVVAKITDEDVDGWPKASG